MSTFNPHDGVTSTPKENFYWWVSFVAFLGLMLLGVGFSQYQEMNVAVSLMFAGVGAMFGWVIVNLIRELRGTGPCARYQAALKDIPSSVLMQILVEGGVQESALRSIRTTLKERQVDA